MKKGIILIMLANVVYLVISVLINFILPKYLTIEAYAEIKSFLLYINYAGLFHLGLIDGVYLKYGGKSLQEIDMDECKTDFMGFFYLELFFSLLILLIGYFSGETLVMLFAAGLVAYNTLSFFKSFYQAIGLFGRYSKLLNSESSFLFVLYALLVYWVGCIDNSTPYILARVVIMGCLCLYCYFSLRLFRASVANLAKVVSNAVENVRQGLLLMLGNFATVLFSGIDRWFVLLFINQRSFAIFAFAVSMEQAVNAFISPITVSMYNYMCRKHDFEMIKLIKNVTMLWGMIVISGGFVAKYVVEKYIPQYVEATNLIFILFAAMAITTVIRGIYLNLYKAERKQKVYFSQMVVMIVIAVILDVSLYLVFKNMMCIAFATFLVEVVWLAICEILDKRVRFSLYEIGIVCVMLTLYLVCGFTLDAVVGFAVYLLCIFALTFFFMKKETAFLWCNIKDAYYKKIKHKQQT